MLILSLVFVMILVFLTMVFSLMTWSHDANSNESKWIFISCVATGGIWLVWTLVATQTSYQYRDATISIAFVFNASMILTLLFLRKVYAFNRYKKEFKGEYGDNLSTYQPSIIGGQYLVGILEKFFVFFSFSFLFHFDFHFEGRRFDVRLEIVRNSERNSHHQSLDAASDAGAAASQWDHRRFDVLSKWGLRRNAGSFRSSNHESSLVWGWNSARNASRPNDYGSRTKRGRHL